MSLISAKFEEFGRDRSKSVLQYWSATR